LGFGFEESMDWLDLYPKKSILFSHQKTKGKYSLADCFMCSVGKHFGTLLLLAIIILQLRNCCFVL
jgi:hypothetical protein